MPLMTWFLATYLINQGKTGLSTPALKRPLGVSDSTAWLLHSKIDHAMAKQDSIHLLDGRRWQAGTRPRVQCVVRGGSLAQHHSARRLEDYPGRCFSFAEVQQVRKPLLGCRRRQVQPPIRSTNAHSAIHRRRLARRADHRKARQSAG